MTRALRIMVIEDYDELRLLICDVLAGDGHQVVGVSNAEDVDDEPTGFLSDLYIIDLNLPGESGISLSKRIRQSQPDAGIVIISARTAVDDRVDGYRSGANTYLTKPLSIDELRAVVAGMTQSRHEIERSRAAVVTLSNRSMVLKGPAGEAQLSTVEFLLLAAFSRVPQQELERWQVASHLGQGEEISKVNLEVKLARLRRKLITCGMDAPAIKANRGIGYKLCGRISVLSE